MEEQDVNEGAGIGPTRLRLRRSGFGIASFGIGLVLVLAILAIVSIDQYFEKHGPALYPLYNRANPKNAKYVRLESIQRGCFYAVAAGWPLGFLLGMLGLYQRHRNRLLPTIGLVLHGALAFWMMVLYLAR